MLGDALTADVMQHPHPDRWGAGILGGATG